MFPKSEKELPVMSAAVATKYVRRMVELETRGFGDTDGAMRRLEGRFGLPFWALWYLRQGRAKKVDSDLLHKIKGAYLNYCESMITSLQSELATEKAITPDADLEDLEAKASELAAEIKAAKIARLNRRGRG
jgi:hypothetical protein